MKTIFAAMQRGLSSTLLIIVLVLSMTSAARAQSGGGPTGGGPTPGGATVSGPVSIAQSPEQIVPAGGGPVPGGPGFVAISGIDFRPYAPSLSYSFSGGALINTDTSARYFVTTFSIPNGATINKMVVYYRDSDPAAGLNVSLLRFPLSYDLADSMAYFSSSGSLSGFLYGETTSITNPLVDLSISTYGLQVYLPPSSAVSLTAVRIDYGYPNSLPVIVNTTP